MKAIGDGSRIALKCWGIHRVFSTASSTEAAVEALLELHGRLFV